MPCGVIIRHITITRILVTREFTRTRPAPWPLYAFSPTPSLYCGAYVICRENHILCGGTRGAWPSVCTEHTSLKCSVLQVRDCCTVSRNEIQRSITAHPARARAPRPHGNIRLHAFDGMPNCRSPLLLSCRARMCGRGDTYNTPMHINIISISARAGESTTNSTELGGYRFVIVVPRT